MSMPLHNSWSIVVIGPLNAKIAGLAVVVAIANDCSAVSKLQFIKEFERYNKKNDVLAKKKRYFILDIIYTHFIFY